MFVSGDPPAEVDEKIGGGDPLITVFMPDGPNPTTGFIVFMPASEVIPLDLAVEDAAKLIVSAGLVGPDQQQEELRRLARPRPASPCPRKSRSLVSRRASTDGVVALEEIEQELRFSAFSPASRIAREDQLRLVARGSTGTGAREAARCGKEDALSAAYPAPRAPAQTQILLGDVEAILRAPHDREPLARRLRQRLTVVGSEQLFRAPSYAPAQLMKLRQPEALRMLDNHDRGVRHVDADLDDSGGDEDRERPPRRNPAITAILLFAGRAYRAPNPTRCHRSA